MQSRFKREKSRRDANESVWKADLPQPAVTRRVRPATPHLGKRTRVGVIVGGTQPAGCVHVRHGRGRTLPPGRHCERIGAVIPDCVGVNKF